MRQTGIPSGSDINERIRRKRDRRLIIVFSFILILLGIIEYILMTSSFSLPLAGNLLFFAIINLNTLLILLLIYLIIRNILKALFEDRARVFGAKLRTKLVMAFIFLSLIPTAILFFISVQFINTSLRLWFDERIERSLEDAIFVGRTYYEEREKWLKERAILLKERLNFACVISQKGGFINASLDADCSRQWLSSLKRQGIWRQGQAQYDLIRGLNIISVFDRHGDLIASYKSIGLVDYVPSISKEQLKQLIKNIEKNVENVNNGNKGEKRGSEAVKNIDQIEIFSVDTDFGNILMANVPIISSSNEGSRLIGLLSIGYLMPHKITELLNTIKAGYEEYQTVKLYKRPLKTTIIITLFLITVLIIFVAIWFGFRLARHITEPLQALADATKRVAQGDLDISLEPKGKDELNDLVGSFNVMTAELKSARARAEKAYSEIEERRHYIETILQNIGTGVISIERSGIIRTVNRSAEQILSINARQTIGRSYKELLSKKEQEEFEHIRRGLLRSSKGAIQRPMRIKVNDRDLSLIVTFTVLRDQTGYSHGVLVVFDDITELEKIQRMAAWREVARRIAHEVKNPLTPIQLNAQRLQRKYSSYFKDKERAVFKRCLDTIVSQVEELKRLVNEFSSFARMPRLRPRFVDLKTLAEEVLFMYKETNPNCNFHLNVATGQLPPFYGDPDQLKRMFMNLIDNAVHAVEDGGQVEVNMAFLDGAECRKDYMEGIIDRDGYVNGIFEIIVVDTGIGIDEEDRQRLFEPYFSKKKGGTGLGLSIVNSIVTDHGGSIIVEPNSPNGTKFIIRFPREGLLDGDKGISS